MAASLAYASGIEAIRTQTVGDMGKQIARLKTELDTEMNKLHALRNSFSYQLGHLLVEAVRTPGRNTLLLPYKLLRLTLLVSRRLRKARDL